MKKTAFIFFVAIEIGLRISLYAVPLRIEDFSLFGQGHSRWAVTDDSAPYHAANVLDIFGGYRSPSKNFQLDTRFTFENPSVSHEYMKKQTFLARMSVTYQKEFSNGKEWFIKAGDLGKITLGEGLTLKDMEAMGFILGIKNSIFSTRLTYIGRGYSDYGDYAIVDIQPSQTDNPIKLGAYCFLQIPENEDQPVSRIISGYSAIRMSPVTINIEAATNLASSPVEGSPIAFLIQPSYYYQDLETRFSFAVAARYYSAAFNAYLNTFPPDKNFHALEEEDEDVDNWRNTLVNTTDAPSDMLGGSIHAKLEHYLGQSVWTYIDSEWVMQQYSFATFNNVFYKLGLSYEWEPKQTVYMGIQNKMFSTEYQENYLSNAPVFMETDPFLVVGLKYWF